MMSPAVSSTQRSLSRAQSELQSHKLPQIPTSPTPTSPFERMVGYRHPASALLTPSQPQPVKAGVNVQSAVQVPSVPASSLEMQKPWHGSGSAAVAGGL